MSDFFPKPEICMTRNKNIFLYEKSVNFIQIKKNQLKLEGHIIYFLHLSGHDIFSIKFGPFFQTKNHLTLYRLNGHFFRKNYENSNIVFFPKRDRRQE